MMLVPPGGVGVIDVRDVADLVTRLLVPGLAPRRVMAGGRFVTWDEWTAVLSEACGRKVPSRPVSAEDMVSLGQEMDRLRAAGQDTPPLSQEAAVIMSAGRPTDDGEALCLLGREYRPTVDTFRDTVQFLRRTGRLAS
jgi:dihydroflavonol-4-reductase